ncbi:homocysteine S-methyltransferase family protein [Knoellia sp. LjRoot47]|uniref:homocysteine S-methyltransferase family protein n=1 Tax=Knoellia sp. LjRoot47 TaxID=3342330 RepID=UPI003ECD1349
MGDGDVAAPATVGSGAGPRWVTDGGLETDLIFNHGVDLPHFAAYPLLDTPEGRALLTDYYTGYAEVARRAGASLLLETPTWRANPDWVAKLGGDSDEVHRVNLESVVFLAALGESLLASGALPAGRHDYGSFRVSGAIGPRGDGYVPGEAASADEFAAYHLPQVVAFADSGAGRVAAYTLTTVSEAVGVVHAARTQTLDVAVSFTVETDGRLPDGTPLGEAVAELWEQGVPDELLVNCAHPSHVAGALDGDDSWTARVTGLRVNASRQSHAELDAAEVLDEGDIPDLVREHDALAARLPHLDVVGGCCGTDVRHVAALWGVDA